MKIHMLYKKNQCIRKNVLFDVNHGLEESLTHTFLRMKLVLNGKMLVNI